MAQWTVIKGPNFSGRSRLLGNVLIDGSSEFKPFFLGPYAETGLSGFAATVRDELQFYGVSVRKSLSPWTDYFAERLTQSTSALSGGEQVLLGLTCLSTRGEKINIGIDCALEQLDEQNRASAIRYLSDLPETSRINLIDHRIEYEHLSELRQLSCMVDHDAFNLILEGVFSDKQMMGGVPTIRLNGLQYAYKNGPTILDHCSITLEPGKLYHLTGENGSGKSTLLKLLSGVLRAQSGSIHLDGEPYEPYRSGNALMAYATQNPDEQWTSITLSGDISTRLAKHIRRVNGNMDNYKSLAIERFSRLAKGMGVDARRERHILDYPRAHRKRLSWIWPLCGLQPWLALDEPTLCQDMEAVSKFADALKVMVRDGYGIIVISHDTRLMKEIDHEVLHIGNGRLSLCD